MTYLELCKKHMRRIHPEVKDEAEIERLAKEFFNASPTGELGHVFALVEEFAEPTDAFESGELDLQPGTDGQIRRIDCGPGKVCIRQGERVLFAVGLTSRARVHVTFFSGWGGWQLTGFGAAPALDSPGSKPNG